MYLHYYYVHLICIAFARRLPHTQGEECTPIKQDVKKGNLRFYPYNINWNYGLLPQVGKPAAAAAATNKCELSGSSCS
jgi:inorganic pyrophosphatase